MTTAPLRWELGTGCALVGGTVALTGLACWWGLAVLAIRLLRVVLR